MDMIIELGFMLFFGSIAPEIVLLFCASNLLRLRVWGWKLLFAVRRPFPACSNGIGLWNRVVYVMVVCAVWCNAVLLVIFNSKAHGTHRDLFFWLEKLVTETVPGSGAANSEHSA